MKDHTKIFVCLTAVCLVLFGGCVKDYLKVQERPKPKVGKETESLEASLITSPVSGPNDPYWNEADYLEVSVVDLSTENLYQQDGLLNMTGTYKGVEDFNKGELPRVRLRAAYDDENIFILAEWDDSKIDASRRSLLWNGPEDPLKQDSANGWTSQRNDDNVALAFDIGSASAPAGTFAEVGCAAACHVSGNDPVMAPTAGAVDIWNWSLALSAPFGFAFDMNATADSGLHYDVGTKTFHRNAVDPNNPRSGPAYEWDGVSQEITKPDGMPGILDPGFYLLNKTPYLGDPAVGAVLYVDHDKGCVGCHGENGEGYGDVGDGPPFDNASFSRKYSRSAIDNFASDATHEGNTYYTKLSESEKEDLIAYIKGLPGVPGYYLTEPVMGESLTDITASDNTNLVRVTTDDSHGSYKVLFTRKLSTGNPDDVAFNPSGKKSYIFGISLMDNDGKNHVGALQETLIFKDQ